MSSKDVSIIIRVRNEAEALRKLLKLIDAQETEFDYEIIVVDSDSIDDTQKVAEENGCYILNIKPSNFSWGRGLNMGIERSNGKYCILVSAHCYPAKNDWIDKLVKPLIENKKIAATYGRQIPLRDVDLFEEVELKLIFPQKEKTRTPISNANACIRREIWEKNRFNEKLKSGEDVEWAMKVRKRGYLIKYVPEAVVYHSHRRNLKYIYNKWYWRGRVNVNLLKDEMKVIKIISNNKLLSNGISWLFFLAKYIEWVGHTTIYCLERKKFREIWKVPFYEVIRWHAFYRGLKDGLADIRKKREIDSTEQFSPHIPLFIQKFEKILK